MLPRTRSVWHTRPHRVGPWGASCVRKSLLSRVGNGSPILANHFHPRELAHHREIDSAETETRKEDVDAIAQRLVMQRLYGLRQRFRAVGLGPSVFDLGVSFINGHPERRVRHREGDEFAPVFGTRQASGGFQPLVERSRR